MASVVTTRSFGSVLKAPMGSAAFTSSASPIRGGVAPKRKKITPCPKTIVVVVTPYHSRSHSLVGQRDCMGSLVSGSSVQTQRVLWVRGWGDQPSDFPFPLPGVILTFWTLIMRGWWGLSFPLTPSTSSASSTSSSTSSSSSSPT